MSLFSLLQHLESQLTLYFSLCCILICFWFGYVKWRLLLDECTKFFWWTISSPAVLKAFFCPPRFPCHLRAFQPNNHFCTNFILQFSGSHLNWKENICHHVFSPYILYFKLLFFLWLCLHNEPLGAWWTVIQSQRINGSHFSSAQIIKGQGDGCSALDFRRS